MTIWENLKLKQAGYRFADIEFIQTFTKVAEEMGCSFEETTLLLNDLEKNHKKCHQTLNKE